MGKIKFFSCDSGKLTYSEAEKLMEELKQAGLETNFRNLGVWVSVANNKQKKALFDIAGHYGARFYEGYSSHIDTKPKPSKFKRMLSWIKRAFRRTRKKLALINKSK